LAGFAPGILVILAIGYGIVRLGLKLPLKRVFAATGSVMLYLAFVFIGKGLYNLQEAGVYAPHPLAWAPDHEALRQLLGLYPLAETILAQAAFLTLLGVGALWYRTRRARAAAPVPSPSRAAETAPIAPRPSQLETAETRDTASWLRFLDRLETFAPGGAVYLILDGLPLHWTVDTMLWNWGHPRFHFVALPKAAAWLNLIAGFRKILYWRALAGVSTGTSSRRTPLGMASQAQLLAHARLRPPHLRNGA
jgi:hypothetical protein